MWSVLPVGDLDFPLKSGQLAECRDKRYVTRNPDLFTPQLCFSQLSQVFRFVRARKGPHVLLIPLISSPFETRHLSTCAFPELRPPSTSTSCICWVLRNLLSTSHSKSSEVSPFAIGMTCHPSLKCSEVFFFFLPNIYNCRLLGNVVD